MSLRGWKKIPLEAKVSILTLLGLFFVWAPAWRFWGVGWGIEQFGVVTLIYAIPVLFSPLAVLVVWLFWRVGSGAVDGVSDRQRGDLE